MNIRGLITNILPVQKTDGARAIKSEITSDRDGNGQMQQGEKDQTPDREMTQAEFEKAISKVEAFPGLKEKGFTVEGELSGSKRFVIVKDSEGAVVRRIPERDLWSLFDGPPDSAKGNLLSKTA